MEKPIDSNIKNNHRYRFLFRLFVLLSFVELFPLFSKGAINRDNLLNQKKNLRRSSIHFKKDLRDPLNLAHKNKKRQQRKLYNPPTFDFPMIYNEKVKMWIKYFQKRGRNSFKIWLERSTRYEPYIKKELKNHKLPQDIFYVAMIESGFSSMAKSHAGAVGLWQFIASTGRRYGLKINRWVDQRRNFTEATRAAIAYKKFLYKRFGSWHLVSASYNMGENRLQRLVMEYRTNDFWELAEMGLLPDETINYIPKIIAAILIAKSPSLYGFKDLKYQVPYKFEEAFVPGGTDLGNLARYLGVKEHYLKELNPDLIRGFIPKEIKSYRIKVPVGSLSQVHQYSRLVSQNTI